MWLSVFAMQLNIVKKKERKNMYIYILKLSIGLMHKSLEDMQ